jgi:hypothetical protein
MEVPLGMPSTAAAVDEGPACPTRDQMETGGLVAIEDEFPVAGPPPGTKEGTQKPELPAGHRLWWRDPIVVFGWIVPLFGLIAFLCYEFLHRTRPDAGQIAAPVPVVVASRDQEPRTSGATERPAVKSAEQPAERPDEKPAEKPDEQPAAKPEENPAPAPPVAFHPDTNGQPANPARPKDLNPLPAPDKAPIPPTGNPPAVAGKTYDLRGPIPRIGFKVREHTTIRGTRMNTFTKPRQRALSARTDLVYTTEKAYTVKDTLSDEVCAYETKVITGDITLTTVDPNGRRRRSQELDDFAGASILSHKTDGTWHHSLLDRAPNDKQVATLPRLRVRFEDRAFFPAEPLKLAATWDVRPEHIEKLLLTDMSAISGKVQARFARVEPISGDTLAVIEYQGAIRGRVEFGDGQEKIGSIRIDVVVYRSLGKGIDVKTTGKIDIRSNDTTTAGGVEIEVATTGILTIDSVASVEQ